MNLFSRITTTLLIVAASVAGFSSCKKEDDNHVTPAIRRGVPVSFVVDDIKQIDTKSVLTDGDIETKVTCVTLAAYSTSTGQLIVKEHFTTGLDSMGLDLAEETEATLYALANMGDMTSAFGSAESSVNSIRYVIPSYTGAAESIEERGIPMAGHLNYSEDGGTGTVIPLRRLLAKVAVDLTVDWPGTISTVQIKNMNKKLTPFGDSKADVSSDVFSEEIESVGDLSSGSFVFFIPENRQGTIGSATTSAGKNNTDAAINAKKDVLTYMEVLVNGTDRYSGTMTYRSYLGKNSTDDFDIVGNYRYTWTVVYKQDGTSIDDWKHENELAWTQYRYNIGPRQYREFYIGDRINLSLRRSEDRYEKGIRVSSSSLIYVDPEIATWTEESFDPEGFIVYENNDSYGRVYLAVAGGTGKMNLDVDDGLTQFHGMYSLRCLGTRPILNPLVLSISPSSILPGGTFQLSVLRDGNEIVGEAGTRFRLIEGRFQIHPYYNTDTVEDNFHYFIDSNGQWSPTEIGTYKIYAYVVEPASGELSSNVVTVTVSEEPVVTESYRYMRLVVSGDSEVTVGNTTSNYTATAYLMKTRDGVDTGDITTEDVSASATFASTSTSVATVSGRNATGVSEGETYITASYVGPYGSVQSYTGNGVKLTVNPVPAADYITLEAVPTTIKVGDNSAATVKFFGTGTDVTTSSTTTIKAYTTENGSSESGIVSISGGIITGVSTGDCWLEAKYTSGGKTYTSACVKITVSAADYITLVAVPTTIKVGDNSVATVKFFGTGSDVTSSSTITAYQTETGSSTSGIVSISGGTITGVSTGDCWLEAKYTSGGKTYTSARVKITVTAASPITVIWESGSEPTYVAQRGKLSIGSLQSGETITSVATEGVGVVRVVQSGSTYYVETLRAGSYTLTVTSSMGRMTSMSGTVHAPNLTLNETTLYANPDGTEAHTGDSGLDGSTLSVTYQFGSTTFTTTTNDVAVGDKFHKGLYNELLAPLYSTSETILHVAGGEVYASDVYEYTGLNGTSAPALGTVTVAPKELSTGVEPKTVIVKKVNPFVEWSSDATNKGDYEDWGLLSGYYSFMSYYNNDFEAKPIKASAGRYGLTAFVNDREAKSDFVSLFSGNVNGGHISWSIGQSDFAALSEHLAGDATLRAYVRNSRSGERVFKRFVSFGLYVHGAVGATLAMKKPKGVSGEAKYEAMYMQAGFVGGTAGTPFANNHEGTSVLYSISSSIAGYNAIDHNLGTCPYWIANKREMANFEDGDDYILNIIPGMRMGTNPETYGPATSPDALFVASDAESFMFSTPSNLEWGTIRNTSLVAYPDGSNVLYMRNSTSDPTRAIGDMDCGYYVLHLLKDIQNTSYKNNNSGWL